MKQGIKARIEMIQRGEVPEGYKKSKVGIISDAWDVISIKKVSSNLVAGGTPSTKIGDYWGGDILWMASGEIHKRYVYDVEKRITHKGLDNSSTRMIPRDSVLIALAGQGKTRGKVAINKVELCTNQSIAAIIPKSDMVVPEYLYYSLDTRYEDLRSLSSGDGGRGGLNLNLISNVMVALPPINEQKKIASILSIWDKAIELKEQLIEEKKKLKKGLMQNLLTGKVRLPGFEGEWDLLKADEIFHNITDRSHGGRGDVLSSTQNKGIIPRNEMDIDIKFDKSNLSNYKKVSAGDFVISLRSFQGGIEYSAYEGLLSPAYIVLRNKVPIAHSYYKHLFKTTDFIKRLNGLIYGIRDGKQIGYKDFSTMKLQYPKVDEQVGIGALLDLATKEIEMLENEKDALLQQKKGLMQLLLTGIVRVPVENAKEEGEQSEKQSVR